MSDPRPTAGEIKSRTLEWLNDTQFAADSIEPLTGGTANFIYRAHLRQPLDDGTAEVVIKHGEGFVANTPAFEISTNRCVRCSNHSIDLCERRERQDDMLTKYCRQ